MRKLLVNTPLNLETEIVIFKGNFTNIYFILILDKCVFRDVSFEYFESLQ